MFKKIILYAILIILGSNNMQASMPSTGLPGTGLKRSQYKIDNKTGRKIVILGAIAPLEVHDNYESKIAKAIAIEANKVANLTTSQRNCPDCLGFIHEIIILSNSDPMAAWIAQKDASIKLHRHGFNPVEGAVYEVTLADGKAKIAPIGLGQTVKAEVQKEKEQREEERLVRMQAELAASPDSVIVTNNTNQVIQVKFWSMIAGVRAARHYPIQPNGIWYFSGVSVHESPQLSIIFPNKPEKHLVIKKENVRNISINSPEDIIIE